MGSEYPPLISGLATGTHLWALRKKKGNPVGSALFRTNNDELPGDRIIIFGIPKIILPK
jgi:hypothetical protein